MYGVRVGSRPLVILKAISHQPSAPNKTVGVLRLSAYQCPAHDVTLKSFWIDRHEVTVATFGEFVNATGYKTEAEKFGWSASWRVWESRSARLPSSDTR